MVDSVVLQWRKSTHSHDDGDHCVELAWTPSGVAVRDSKAPDRGHLVVLRRALSEVVARIGGA